MQLHLASTLNCATEGNLQGAKNEADQVEPVMMKSIESGRRRLHREWMIKNLDRLWGVQDLLAQGKDESHNSCRQANLTWRQAVLRQACMHAGISYMGMAARHANVTEFPWEQIMAVASL